MKDGIATSEFWTLFGVSIPTLIPTWNSESDFVKVAGLACFTAACIGYMVSRAIAKCAHANGNGKTPAPPSPPPTPSS